MCWNEKVSWITFIQGTILNIITIAVMRKPMVTAACLFWQWVLLMQLFEALMWKDQNCGKLNKDATTGAYVANVMQPMIAYFLFMYVSNVSNTYKIIASIIMIIYTVFIIANTFTMNKITCVKASCSHLKYGWWTGISGVIYVTTILSIAMLLVRPLSFMGLFVGWVVLTLGIAILSYNKTVASMWCWFAAFAPFFTGFGYWMCTRKT